MIAKRTTGSAHLGFDYDIRARGISLSFRVGQMKTYRYHLKHPTKVKTFFNASDGFLFLYKEDAPN
jgi:hypothetical protein